MKNDYYKYDKQIDELMNKMTLHEKIGQLNQIFVPSDAGKLDEFRQKIRNGEVGSLLFATSQHAGNDPQGHIKYEFYDELQKIAVEESRLHIPMIYGRDVIHGHRTVSPLPLANASSFDPELVEKCYRNTAVEAVNDGIHWAFAPMLDMSRDPRWGRMVESPGEDPYLGAQMAKACVRGFQNGDISKDDSLAACGKHYVGYGASEGGRDYHKTEISDYNLYNYYLPAFRAAAEEGVATVMSSFNDINGQPVTSSRKYLTDILRGKLGFEGYVISDWEAVVQLKAQGVAADDYDCAKLAVSAGLDMDMVDECYINNLEKAVENGDVSEEIIDTAVKRVLRIKFAKGLFVNPYRREVKFDRNEHLKDARRLAAESMILLKNNGVLPLKKDESVVLLGPMRYERRSLLGTWCLDGRAEETKNLYEAMQERNIELHGMGEYDNIEWQMETRDVVVLALGESFILSGENHSVADISLSEEQRILVRKARKYGKKVVGVFFSGRPMALEGVAEDLDAVLYAWHGGSCCADAVCDILFGDSVPCGKTSVTFPRKTGHIPLYYNATPSGRPCNCYYGDVAYPSYLDGQSTPYYPFGYGLSYTTFEYGEIKPDKTEISLEALKNGETIKLSVEVKNTGEYDGKEIAELYIHDVLAMRMRPLRELKGFKKVLINKGETAKVEFELGYDKLGFYDEDGNYAVEPGEFEIYIGENCLTKNSIGINVTK